MKHNWEYKRLGDLCNISSSRRVLQSDWKESGVPFYRAREIVKLSENGFVNNELFISENLYDELAKSGIPQAGDIMLSAVGTLGATYIVKPTDKFYYKDASVICLSKISDLQPKFLCYLFDSNIILHQIDRQAKGATVGTITISNASKFKVPVPDYKVQEQIVAELDKINETIEDCRELLRNLDALAQSLFYEYFGKFYIDNSPHYKSLKEVFDTVTDFVAAGSFASLRENVIYQDSPNYAQLVRTMDIKSNFTKGQFVFVDKHAFDFLWRVNLDKECIILPNIGVNCGEVYHLKPSNLIYDNNVLGPNAILVRSSKYNHLFLSFALKSDDFQKQLSKITSQVAQPKFNKTNLKELKVLIPPLALQEQFAARIEQIEVQKKAVEQTIAELQTLLDSRMDYWFN